MCVCVCVDIFSCRLGSRRSCLELGSSLGDNVMRKGSGGNEIIFSSIFKKRIHKVYTIGHVALALFHT